MPATSGFTPSQIARAMETKAEDAYGEMATGSFDVRNVQQHRADVTFTVSVDYSCQYVHVPVQYATGPMYDPSQIMGILTQRQDELLAYPGHYREQMQSALRSAPDLYREPKKFRLLGDDHVCCSIEDCGGCHGQGQLKCTRCSGTCNVLCRECGGTPRMRCSGCSGTGNTSHSTHCVGCGGSGRYMGTERCNQCNGRGVAGSTCGRCHGSGTMTCGACFGGGTQRCTACNSGKVTCNTCHGACQLIYQYHLDIYADTTVRYRWTNLSASWLEQPMSETMNTPQRHTLFELERYHLENDDPCVFTAVGHVQGVQATVFYEGHSGECRFIGPKLSTVFLDGVLSGGFKKCVEGVEDYKNIRKVSEASNSKIARQLIKEVANRVDVSRTTPVTKGIISENDATMFIASRSLTQAHILTTRRQFRWGAAFGFSFPLCGALICLYALMTYLTHGVPSILSGNEGYMGILALMHNPGQVFRAFLEPLRYLLYSVWVTGDYWQLLCWVLAAMLSNRFILLQVAPRVCGWAEGSLGRAILLAFPGMLFLSLLMAFNSSNFVLMRFSSFIPSLHFNMSAVLTFLLVTVPQIWMLSFAISLISYKAAGSHWGARMMRLLKPNEGRFRLLAVVEVEAWLSTQ